MLLDMNDKLTSIEKQVLAVVQHGFPLTLTPYSDMAEEIGVHVDTLLELLKLWRSRGIIRRAGAIVNHFKVGISGGAMVVWKVPVERIMQVGQILAGFKEVSHAYQRPVRTNWPYNLYTMVHGTDIADTEETVKRMSNACAITNYRLLNTVKELKKAPPTYIISRKKSV